MGETSIVVRYLNQQICTRLAFVPTVAPADKSISGVVVDANGAPAAGVPIFISGPRGSDTAGQPRREAVSDEQGRFFVEGVCPGPLRIQAGFGGGPGGSGGRGGHAGHHAQLWRRHLAWFP